MIPILDRMPKSRFHGRYEESVQRCSHPVCDEPGEFRAPGTGAHSFDGPGQWRWLCLEHVREFNAGYNWFEGMNAEEILDAQGPAAGWRTESPAFDPTAATRSSPRWADFDDPLDAISARAAGIKSRAQKRGEAAMDGRFSADEAQAFETLGLSLDASRADLRKRYTELVRRYHPDQNGGDRQFETRLGKVVDAYQLLKKSTAFSRNE